MWGKGVEPGGNDTKGGPAFGERRYLLSEFSREFVHKQPRFICPRAWDKCPGAWEQLESGTSCDSWRLLDRKGLAATQLYVVLGGLPCRCDLWCDLWCDQLYGRLP